MANEVQSLVTWLKGACEDALGPEYSELSQAYDVAKNSFKTAKQRYAVLPGAAQGTEGVTKFYTVEHEYIIKLTDGFATSNSGDSNLQTKVVELQDKAHAVFAEIYNTRTSTSIVLNVYQTLTLEEPEILVDDRVVVVTMRFTLLYRQPLN